MSIKKPEQKVNIQKDSLSGIEYPVFCFKHLQHTSIKDCTDHEFFFSFLDRLQKLCALGWSEIRRSHRHAYGMEKVSVDEIIPKIPAFITPDVTHLHVFRASGDNRPFLGLQKGKLFHIIFIETNFGDIYKH